jgi:hypothetical protein
MSLNVRKALRQPQGWPAPFAFNEPTEPIILDEPNFLDDNRLG